MQLTRGGSYRRGSLVPVQMLVRAGSLAGNTRAASNPDFFIDPTHARRGRWPVAGIWYSSMQIPGYGFLTVQNCYSNKPMETQFVGKGKCLS